VEIKKNDRQATPTNMSYTDYRTLEHLGEGTTTKGDLISTHLSSDCPAMQTPSVGEICEYPEVSSFHVNPYLHLEIVLVLASCSIKKRKKMRGVAMVTMLNTSSTNHRGKYSQCPYFDIKQIPAGRSPEDR